MRLLESFYDVQFYYSNLLNYKPSNPPTAPTTLPPWMRSLYHYPYPYHENPVTFNQPSPTMASESSLDGFVFPVTSIFDIFHSVRGTVFMLMCGSGKRYLRFILSSQRRDGYC